MASSGNFCTINPLVQSDSTLMNGTLSNGNVKYVSSGDDGWVCNMAMTNKTYCEVRIDALSNYGGTIGFRSMTTPSQTYDAVTFQCNASSGVIYHYKGTSDQSYSGNIGGTVSAGSIVMMAFDPTTYKWWVGVNGTWRNSGDPANGTGFVFEGSSTMFEDMSAFVWGGWKGGANGISLTYNFGQDDSFSGQVTSGSAGASDSAGFGSFYYSPPDSFLANCSGNIAISDDIDPAQTDDDYPSKQFNAITYSGDNTTSNNITGLGFQPDLVWIKRRSSPDSNYSNSLMDSSRGHAKVIYAQMNNAERTSPSNKDLVSFDSDGFTVGQNYETNSNGSGHNHVAWCWRANGGVTSSNSEGATNSTVQANTKAGFSIIQYVGTGSNTTIGHGLDTAPDFMIHKNRDTTDNFVVYARSQGASKRAQLNSNIVWGTSTGSFNSTDPSSTLITLGSSSGTNASSGNYVCYAWHNVEGYQRFGTYIGNNTDNNGPFCYLGFRPRLLVIKGATEAYPWFVFDSARNPHNLVDKHLRWNGADAEATETTGARKVDFLSNGFRVMADEASLNGSGDTYVYMAWADVSFKYGNTF